MKKQRLIPLALLALGIIGVAYGIELWLIDSAGHYVTVSPVSAYMQYSLDNNTWVNITSVSAGSSWYARLRLNYDGAPMQVRVGWELFEPGSTWTTPLSFETAVTLSVGWQEIYVSPTGLQSSNVNWGNQTTPSSQWDYRVRARITEI